MYASLIPGFEYDVSISYRQKDNKHDGWVIEFANNLKGELESTFKEEISVYFDINPHDGLLESHVVEQASQDQFGLKVKLPNGNVASRMLPVRIHYLDFRDIKECESVLGGVLRGIEFIYWLYICRTAAKRR